MSVSPLSDDEVSLASVLLLPESLEAGSAAGEVSLVGVG